MTAALVPSSPWEIDAALRNHNPFPQDLFLGASHVWGKVPDLSTLNAHASDAVFQALREVRASRLRTSILITAEAGTGKTHVINRVRRYLQEQGEALFIYATRFSNLDQDKQEFQQIIADSLSNNGSQGVRQWQELAAVMANDALKANDPQAQALTAQELIDKFENSDEEQFAKWIKPLTKAFCKVKTVRDPDIVQAIFWTLSSEQSLYAMQWLGGNEISQHRANELCLPSQCQSFDAILQILALISEYYQLVICFDELDTANTNSYGRSKAEVVVNLIKDLYDNICRGVILTVMMPGIWTNKVKSEHPQGVWQRTTTYGDTQPLELRYIDGDSVIELATCFLRDFYRQRRLIPPHPFYPFSEQKLREIGKQKLPVRDVLRWFRENCVPPIPPPDPVEVAFNIEMNEVRGNYLDNNALIANSLLFGFQGLIGQMAERMIIENATDSVKNRSKDKFLNFKILGKTDNRNVCVGIAVLQYDGGNSLGAGLKRLVDDSSFQLTRGCLVRSKNKPISAHLQKRYLNPLIRQKGGEFVDLKEEEIKPLIAIHSVYQKRDDYKLAECEISKFISERGAEKLLGIHNPLLQEILTDPSHQVPVIQDEPEVCTLMQPEDISLNELTPSDINNLAELATHE